MSAAPSTSTTTTAPAAAPASSGSKLKFNPSAKAFVPSFTPKPAAAATASATAAAPAPATNPAFVAASSATVIDMKAPYYALDIECVATGKGHNDRAVAQIALVDSSEKVILNIYVRPSQTIVSHLTALTSITAEKMADATTLEDAVKRVRAALPTNAILVGQSISKDINWCGLTEGKDFSAMQDLGGLWRVWNARYQNFSAFSLGHECKVLLGYEQPKPHDAVSDSIVSMRLYQLYRNLTTGATASKEKLEKSQAALLATPPEPSFASLNPTVDGVCMGYKKTCKCGNPFFF